MKNIIFDIETIPDYQGIKKIIDYNNQSSAIEDLSGSELIYKYWQNRHPEITKEQAQAKFLPIHLHQVVTIGLIIVDFIDNSFNLLTISNENESQIIKHFFNGIEKYKTPAPPQLVTWNGAGFDLPVLHYRSLIHKVSCQIYWEVGDQIRDFRYNNYLNRFHLRHLDLMDMLANYNFNNFIRLDEISKLCSFPGKQGIGGANVAEEFQKGNLEEICNYCEADVINTYLLYLRFLLISARHDAYQTQSYIQQLKQWIVDNRSGEFWTKVNDKILIN